MLILNMRERFTVLQSCSSRLCDKNMSFQYVRGAKNEIILAL